MWPSSQESLPGSSGLILLCVGRGGESDRGSRKGYNEETQVK